MLKCVEVLKCAEGSVEVSHFDCEGRSCERKHTEAAVLCMCGGGRSKHTTAAEGMDAAWLEHSSTYIR